MSLGWWLSDTAQMIRRNLLHIRRTPELLLDVTVSPIMFVLLFTLVFGGAIDVRTATYTNYLMAGIFVQTIAFAGVYTGVLLANDLKNGMIDRFRSLPMSQSAVLTGRTSGRPFPGGCFLRPVVEEIELDVVVARAHGESPPVGSPAL